GLIAAAQKIEHHEIAAYGCVRTYAELLGRKDCVRLLQQTLVGDFEAGATSWAPARCARAAGTSRDSPANVRSVLVRQRSRAAPPAAANGTRARRRTRAHIARVAADSACPCCLCTQAARDRRRSRSCARTARRV